jgi:hypothetical protein
MDTRMNNDIPMDDFKARLRIAADEAVAKQLPGLEHHLRMAFYAGVDFGMERGREEMRRVAKELTS